MRVRESAEAVCPVCGYRHEQEVADGLVLQPGTYLGNGKYLVGKVLGQGGFGITYVGLDLSLQRKVAIKEFFPMGQVSRNKESSVLLWSQATDGGTSGRESFLKEARKMAKMDMIPGIVQVLDVFYQNGTAYIVMTFIEGETLKAKLKREGLMVPDECLKLLRPVMHSLDEAHHNGLIHRDISPDNIMIDPKGKTWILDMGAAKDLDTGSREGMQSTQAVVKHGFSPPEQQTTGGKNIGAWTDVYAMCATIYYCLTGKLVPDAMDRLMNDTLSFPDSIPQPVSEVLKDGLMLRPEDRIQNLEELANAFDRVYTKNPDIRDGGEDGQDAAVNPEETAPEQPADGMPEIPAEENKDSDKQGGEYDLGAEPAHEVTSEMAEQPDETEKHSDEAVEQKETDVNPTPPTKKKAGKKWLIPALAAAVVGLAVVIMVMITPDSSGSTGRTKNAYEGMSAEQLYNRGSTYFSQRQYKKALEAYEQAAELGSLDALNDLGYMYKNGLGVKEDDTAAYRYFFKAASKGYALAMANLGIMYRYGYGVKENPGMALKWLRKSAEAGEPSGMYLLGEMYYCGEGVDRDYKEAMNCFQIAAENGDASAMYMLGYMYQNGEGVTKDYRKAYDWYVKAAEGNDPDGLHAVGEFYENGWVVSIDRSKAQEYYRKAEQYGYTE